MSHKPLLTLKDKHLREDIVEKHFRLFYKTTYGVDLPSKLVGRDCPYDFKFESVSTPSERYRLEIVSLKESETSHQQQSVQRILREMLAAEPHAVVAILFHNLSTKDLPKLVKQMKAVEPIAPYPTLADDLFREAMARSTSIVRRLVPVTGKQAFVTAGENLHVTDAISAAVAFKEAKNYQHVAEMTLIVDDQAIEYSRELIEKELRGLALRHQSSPFKEIFIYSGAYSDDNATGSAFSILPIKCDRDANLRYLLKAHA